VPTDKAVLSRDRIFVLLGLTLLTVLAWSYLLWLSTDMGMGGMDMTGLRMIPSGFGLMVPANMPWRAMEFAFVFVMWIVMMVSMILGSANVSYVRPRRPTDRSARHANHPNCLVRCWLFACLDRFRIARHASAVGVRAYRVARFRDGKHGQPFRGALVHKCWCYEQAR